MAECELAVDSPLRLQQFERKFFSDFMGLDGGSNTRSFDDVPLPLAIPDPNVPILTALDLVDRDAGVSTIVDA
jgi:hypothetical protein